MITKTKVPQSSRNKPKILVIWRVIRLMTVIAKRELLFAANWGIAAWLAGLTFINRTSRGQAGQAMNSIMDNLKKKNIKLWVFSEGTRRNTGEIHELKKGAFYAAIHAQVPIIPVVFSSYQSFLSATTKTFISGEVIITALPEISTKGLTVDDIDDLIERTRQSMIAAFKEVNKELKNDLKVQSK